VAASPIGSRAWAEEQIESYAKRRPDYVVFGETLERVLREIAKKHSPAAIVQVRPKTIPSFAEKIFRKKAKCMDPVNEFTDLCGGRVITHTADEVEAISRFIEESFLIDWENSEDVSRRLKPSEFGYRSVHYIVTFAEGVFPSEDVPVEIPQSLYSMANPRAEVQVRTLLDHSWADISHDRAYKSGFLVPEKWERELARLAAQLEDCGEDMSRICYGLAAYETSYGSYMNEDEMRAEIEIQEFVLEQDPADTKVAAKIGRLAIALGDWAKAVEVLSAHSGSRCSPVLRDLGLATCKLHASNPSSRRYLQGREYLERAIKECPGDADALASLAGTWKGIDDDKARDLYRRAHEIDPADPYPLVNYLELQVASTGDASVASLLAPSIRDAIGRCRAHIEVGVNLPWAFYSMGQFLLLLGRPHESLSAYAKAIQLSTADFMIETTLRSVQNLAPAREKLPGYEWIRRLLLLARASKYPCDDTLRPVKELASDGAPAITMPVVIVAGGAAEAIEQVRAHGPLLLTAFEAYSGTIISGGTTEGVSGLVGDVKASHPAFVHTVGYVSRLVPADATVDRNPERYDEIRETDGEGFSPLEPLQNWIDIISSGISPGEVRLLGINGGPIAAAEYRIALALGAWVGILEGSGREAAKLLPDEDWKDVSRLVALPLDAATVRAFIGPGATRVESGMRERLAQAIHETYREARKSAVLSEEPSLSAWEGLPEHLKESNRQQADDMFEKLRRIGCAVQESKHDDDLQPAQLAHREVEMLAEMEHARWNRERLMDGWVWGEKRDVLKKVSPYLVSWADLPEEVKEWDRETVRKIPEFLAEVGLEIARQEE